MDLNIQITIYQTLRSEILQRLSSQQQIINFTLVLMGIFPIIFREKEKKAKSYIVAFITGAFLSLLLALVSLRQYISVSQLAEYISTINKDFSLWERFCRQDILFGHKLNQFLITLTGISGVLFPLIISFMYLLPPLNYFGSNIKKPSRSEICLAVITSILILGILFTGYQAYSIRQIVIGS